ncbi:MAG TPA: lamin tail domain-containing protein [Acidimicrobiia bacterium]
MTFAAATLLLVACTSTNQPSAPPTIAPRLPVASEVVSITDGDTLQVMTSEQELSVRLAAINAPDLGECLHEEATAHLMARVSNAPISLEVVGIDQFDRTLAHVLFDDRHINHEMVAIGLALVSDPVDDPYRAVLLDAEEAAFDTGMGLWAGDACGVGPPSPDIAIDPAASEPDPRGPDEDRLGDEVVTVANQGTETVDISGWTLRDTSSRHRYTFPEGTVVGPGEAFEVRSDHPGWSPGSSAVWNNDGDMALLLDPVGQVVSRWRY